MFGFEKSYKIPSKTQAGVVFEIKRINLTERASRELYIADHVEALDAIQRKAALFYQEVRSRLRLSDQEDVSESSLTEQEREQLATLNGRASRILNAYIIPAVVRSQVLSITNGEEAGDVEDLISIGDDNLLFEAYTFCEAAGRLTPQQLKNLESPGTSREAVAGQSESTTVATAKLAA